MRKLKLRKRRSWGRMLSKEIRKYDDQGRLIYYKDRIDTEMFITYDNGKHVICKNPNGYRYTRDYDTNGNLIHYANSEGFKYWKEYNENNICIHYKNSHNLEEWYNARGELIHCKLPNGEEEFYNLED